MFIKLVEAGELQVNYININDVRAVKTNEDGSRLTQITFRNGDRMVVRNSIYKVIELIKNEVAAERGY